MKTARPGLHSNRRSFLKNSALLGLNAAAATFSPVSDAKAFLFGKKEQKVSATKLVMGTYVTITCIHNSEDQAEEAIALAFAEINRLNTILSRHISSTPIAHLNRSGSLGDAPPELMEVVQGALSFHNTSFGAFDITVLPLLELYENCYSDNTVPGERDITRQLELVGAPHISTSGSTIRFDKEGMGITTDGIAKGYVVDRASSILLQKGIKNHLINAGGDIKTSGNGLKGKPWTIAIQDPSKGGDYPEILRMSNGAVATSGNYEIYFDEAKLFHHIVDPESGRSPLLSQSVTVTAPTVMEADALSTAIFVLEPDRGRAFIDGEKEYHCLIVDRNDRVIRSRNWHRQR